MINHNIKQTLIEIVGGLILLILIVFIIFSFSGCYTENKAKKQFNKAVISYPKIPLDYCAAQFPDKPDSVIVKTDTVTEVIFMDSLVNNTDTLYRDSLGFKYRTITKIVTKTIKRDSIIYRENRAEQERLQLALLECQKNTGIEMAKNTKLEQDLAKWKRNAKIRWWWIALLIGGFVGTIAIKIFGKTKFPI